jgi:O-antigen ligase/tetratricopeptide (TPR) repeat protein
MKNVDSAKILKAIALIGVYGGLLLPLAFFPVVIFPFVFSKLIFFQVLIGLTFPAYVALAWARPEYRPKSAPLYWALVAYLIAVALSVVFSVDPSRSWWGNQERMNGLFSLLHFFAWLTMSTSLIKTWNQWKKLLMFEILISGVMAVVSLLQIPYPKLLGFPASDRVGGLLDNPIYMAAYQIFNLFFILLLWLKGVSNKTKVMFVVIGLLDIGAFIAAQSRGALVGLAAGIVIFALTFVAMAKNKKVRFGVIGAMVAFFLAYGAIYAARNTDFISHSPLSRLTNFQVTTETRFIAWQIAWEGFLERPLTGWGFDDFHILFNLKYKPVSLEYSSYETWFDRAHNTVMDALSMTGIFGTLTYFGIFGALFYSVIQARRRGVIDTTTTSVLLALPVAYFVQNLFVFDQPAGFTTSYLLYALVIRACMPGFFDSAEKRASVSVAEAHAKPLSWSAFGVLQILGLVLVWRTSVLPAQASILTIKSNNAFSMGDYQAAYDDAKQAAQIPTPYLDEQAFLQSRNLIALQNAGSLQKTPNWKEWYQLTKDVSVRSLTEHPRNTNPLFIYARFIDTMSHVVPEDTSLVRPAYEQAIATSPKRQQLISSYAQHFASTGNLDKALELYRQASDLDPNVGEMKWYLGATMMLDANQPDAGAKEILDAMSAKVPFSLSTVRDAVILAKAEEIEKKPDDFNDLLVKVPTLSGGDISLYLELARTAEHLNLMPQRDAILKAIIRVDATTASRFDPIFTTHTATSIEDSLQQTQLVTQNKTATTTQETGTDSGPRK